MKEEELKKIKMNKRQESINEPKNKVLDIADVICCGDLVHIEHIDSFFEVLEIKEGKFTGAELGRKTLETHILDVDEINTLWCKSHCI